MGYLFLMLAIAAEVTATSALKATDGFTITNALIRLVG